MRLALGEMDGVLHHVLTRAHDGVTAPRRAVHPRDDALVVAERQLHVIDDLAKPFGVDGVGDAQILPLGVEQPHVLLGLAQALVERHQRKRAVTRSQGEEGELGAVRQIHHHRIAPANARILQSPSHRGSGHTRLTVRVGRLHAASIDKGEKHLVGEYAGRVVENVDQAEFLRELGVLSEVGSALLLERVAALLRLVGGVV